MQPLQTQASELVRSLSEQCTGPTLLGSMSPSVYDTAWVSMVRREVNGNPTFLFPESFTYLLETQLADGTWPLYSTRVDGILNTLAALLALKVRSRHDAPSHLDLKERCSKAEKALTIMLADWDARSSDRVGLELLLPCLLRLLGNEGVHLSFPDFDYLSNMGKLKMNRLGQLLYSGKQTTLLHSLDAVVDAVNFDELRSQKLENGSMMNSPSSTAAYLMNISVWDDQAEAYLRSVMDQSLSRGYRGGVASAFPSPIFELSWVLTTLLERSYALDDFDPGDLSNIANFLEQTLKDQDWTVGFAPHCMPDADDTAKSLLALRLMGRKVEFGPLLEHFEKDDYFITYPGERNSSFSANCNALIALLHSGEVGKYATTIVKCASFLNEAWKNGKVHDKWNTTRYYSIMLLAQAFTGVLDAWRQGQFERSDDLETLVNSLYATVLDIYVDILRNQGEDGSWMSSHEVTSYAILALASLLGVSWSAPIAAPGKDSFERGKAYILKKQDVWAEGAYLWIEKVAYSSSHLSMAYCLAASNVSLLEPTHTDEPDCPFLEKQLLAYSRLFSALSTFSKCPSWKLEVSLAQMGYFATELHKLQLMVFPKMGKTEAHKYLQFIPITWLGPHYMHGSGVSMSVLWEMMVISMLDYQADAYMESYVTEELCGQLYDVRRIIDEVIDNKTPGTTDNSNSHGKMNGSTKVVPNGIVNGGTNGMAKLITNGTVNGITNGTTNGRATTMANAMTDGSTKGMITSEITSASGTDIPGLRTTMSNFATHVLRHPAVLRSPRFLQVWLSHSLRAFLQAHVTQIEDNKNLSAGKLPAETYYHWVHTTSSDHTSCLYSFVFYLCLMHDSRTGPESEAVNLFPSPKTKYLLETACRHLAIICRQHNDIGSVVRDNEERNLNGVDFPEFAISGADHMDEEIQARKIRQAKQEILEISRYEQRAMEMALEQVRGLIDEEIMREIMLFFQVTNLYGEIYLARDMTSTKSAMKEGPSSKA